MKTLCVSLSLFMIGCAFGETVVFTPEYLDQLARSPVILIGTLGGTTAGGGGASSSVIVSEVIVGKNLIKNRTEITVNWPSEKVGARILSKDMQFIFFLRPNANSNYGFDDVIGTIYPFLLATKANRDAIKKRVSHTNNMAEQGRAVNRWPSPLSSGGYRGSAFRHRGCWQKSIPSAFIPGLCDSPFPPASDT